MKVYIGPYPKWWGPYQLAEKIPFISEDRRHAIGEWLSDTWVLNACQWMDGAGWKQRNINVEIHPYDVWNMDHTLALVALPMLKLLQKTKHGSPMVDDEDVPETLRYSDPRDTRTGAPAKWGADNWVHYKWEWVLNEIIWTFEQWVNDDRDEPFYEKGLDSQECKDYHARIQNGFRLFGKYYTNLWD